MAYRETLPRRGIARRQMMKRVARFSRLKGFDGGLPDEHPNEWITMPSGQSGAGRIHVCPFDVES